jgi:hypothetical protein
MVLPLGGSGNGVYTPATFIPMMVLEMRLLSTGTGGTYGRRFSPIGQGFMIEVVLREM